MEEDVFSYVTGMNATFLDEIYRKYLEDPLEVDASFRGFFAGMALAKESLGEGNQDIRVIGLIESYRKHGHKKASVDPLQETPMQVKELELSRFGFSKEDLSLKVPTFGFLKEKQAPLGTLINALEERYCRGIGFEVEGLFEELDLWIRSNMEKNKVEISKEDRLQILDDIMQIELFEMFMHVKYPGQTRFSLEGGETLIPLLRFLLEAGGQSGLEEIILGMAHRGRLSVLTGILGKTYQEVFEEFKDMASSESSGDVKYHRGAHTNFKLRSGTYLNIALASNPSHLESINPVVEGQVRAKQELKNTPLAHKKVAALLIHGDASLAGQGVIYELLQMSKLKGYETGGSLHIVINNHIGYTTLPSNGRSTLYCTDIAKAFGCPVFHVNAERPIECIEAAFLAIQIRQKFHVDVFIDLNCYRKYGHNEGDEPSFTQPLEYKQIRAKSPIRKILEEQLILEKVISKEEVLKKEDEFTAKLHDILTKVQSLGQSFQGESCKRKSFLQSDVPSVSSEKLQEIAKKISLVPEGFKIHPKLQKILQGRLNMVQDENATLIDWGMAEHLAFGSLLEEKMGIRLSGQDVGRGTFSHRHAVWVDQETGKRYIPLEHIKEGQGPFSLYDSPLSEFGVMGFDLGYSLAHPKCLVLWEAQYGDFYNGAQVVVDQYLATSEQKWDKYSNMVLLLPHGYEGKGPEHSSARIERFLQLCAEDNLIVANCTTPAQFFHLLRRQSYLEVKRPLIVFSPKVLLRHGSCVSSIKDLSQGVFQGCLEDPIVNKKAKTLLLCSGKVFYDLLQERKTQSAQDIAILRIEQLYPFPEKELMSILESYKEVTEWIWVQEEPKNMGPWRYVQAVWEERYNQYAPLRYIGRKESASPATGSYAVHKKQQEEIMQEVFKIKEKENPC
ncbi:MAG: 2-oxoglutarate dehydrogenase E1 component [Chlamydiota bacterium]